MTTSSQLHPDNALAVYGTLRPGETNGFLLRDIAQRINGHWIEGHLRGYEYDVTWGPAEGYPGLTLDDGGHRVDVMVLVSDQWPGAFAEVDRFEGPGYTRRPAALYSNEAELLGQVSVYEALTDID